MNELNSLKSQATSTASGASAGRDIHSIASHGNTGTINNTGNLTINNFISLFPDIKNLDANFLAFSIFSAAVIAFFYWRPTDSSLEENERMSKEPDPTPGNVNMEMGGDLENFTGKFAQAHNMAIVRPNMTEEDKKHMQEMQEKNSELTNTTLAQGSSINMKGFASTAKPTSGNYKQAANYVEMEQQSEAQLMSTPGIGIGFNTKKTQLPKDAENQETKEKIVTGVSPVGKKQ